MHYNKHHRYSYNTFDIEGNVVAVYRFHPELYYLKINQNVLFLVTIQDKIQNDQIKYYTLIAESEEYAVVTKFSI